jgi:hypothetical protein
MKTITVVNKRTRLENVKKKFPDAYIFDVTSSSENPDGKVLSPFYPHGRIPVPGDSKTVTASCVEGIWQGLKVFENCGIDVAMFRNDTMKNIKRTVRKFGKPLGHQYGVFSIQLLNYDDAKRLIYIPSYKYMLENVPSVKRSLDKLRAILETQDVVLLDYNVNPDNAEKTKPLSHAELIKMYIEGRYPEE